MEFRKSVKSSSNYSSREHEKTVDNEESNLNRVQYQFNFFLGEKYPIGEVEVRIIISKLKR